MQGVRLRLRLSLGSSFDPVHTTSTVSAPEGCALPSSGVARVQAGEEKFAPPPSNACTCGGGNERRLGLGSTDGWPLERSVNDVSAESQAG
jgi:hypothetical protein